MTEGASFPVPSGASSAAPAGRYVCIHGHFYQPPRENPWLEAIEGQPSAYPYHDWNERITAECYAPNANARILDGENRIVAIVNNYSSMSFNFGPTLLSWLEEKEPEVYRAILAADAESRRRFGGHGSALAQPYNHMILPLANSRDRRTQVVWGIRDFEHRFGRRPEGMWLPETAVDLASLEALAAEGIAFTILAPHQALRVRKIGDAEWTDVRPSGVDPTMPYRVALPSGASIAVYFYDGPISRAVAFERLLATGERFADRLVGGFGESADRPQLVHIATDGETYGHHHRHGDMALAYALHMLESRRLTTLTNYGEFLASHPPTHEAEIAENTSWSCAHGVERWRSDCGCQTGAHPGWTQAWRAPLREALDALRDMVAPLWEAKAGALLADPWTARDEAIDVLLDRRPESIRRFLATHAVRELTAAERIEVLKLLELQRHAQLMYTSCAWFFDDVGGIEARQIVQYAGRVLQLAGELFGPGLEEPFLSVLEKAKSNEPGSGDGRRIYDETVRPAVVSLEKVGAHYAVSSLFADYAETARVYCYEVERDDYRLVASGRARLALGRGRVRSGITGEAESVAFGVLHLGDHNLSGGAIRFPGEAEYAELVASIEEPFRRADLTETLRAVDRRFGSGVYTLRLLFRDEQQRVLGRMLQSVLGATDSVYRELYEEHAPLMRFLSSHGIAQPRGFRLAAELALNMRLRRELEQDAPDPSLLSSVLEEARDVGIALHEDGVARAVELALERLADGLRAKPAELSRLEELEAVVDLARRLPFEVDFWKAQNAYFRLWKSFLPSRIREADAGFEDARRWVELFRSLGRKLAMNVTERDADGSRADGGGAEERAASDKMSSS
jgi:alpha-amylase/alpha-mannosidase (GH57 family)